MSQTQIIIYLTRFERFYNSNVNTSPLEQEIIEFIKSIDNDATISEILEVKYNFDPFNHDCKEMCDYTFVLLEYYNDSSEETIINKLNINQELVVPFTYINKEYLYKIKKFVGTNDPRKDSILSHSTIFTPKDKEKQNISIESIFNKKTLPTMGFRDAYTTIRYEY